MLVMISPDNQFRDWKYIKGVFVLCVIQGTDYITNYFFLNFRISRTNIENLKQ